MDFFVRVLRTFVTPRSLSVVILMTKNFKKQSYVRFWKICLLLDTVDECDVKNHLFWIDRWKYTIFKTSGTSYMYYINCRFGLGKRVKNIFMGNLDEFNSIKKFCKQFIIQVFLIVTASKATLKFMATSLILKLSRTIFQIDSITKIKCLNPTKNTGNIRYNWV